MEAVDKVMPALRLNGHAHLDTASLPSLHCSGPLQGWVQPSTRLCPSPLQQSLKETVLHKISSSQTGSWVSQVASPSTLGSAYLYQEISTIITFFLSVQSNYLFLVQFILQQTLALESSAES